MLGKSRIKSDGDHVPGLPANNLFYLREIFLLAAISLPAEGCRWTNEDPPQVLEIADHSVDQFENAVAVKDWDLARKLSGQALISRPNDADLVTKVATVAAFSDSKREAAELLVDAAKLANYQPPSRVNFAVQALIDVGDIYTAIDLLEASLVQHPEINSQRRALVGFLNEVQRTERIPEHLRVLIKNRDFDFPLLLSTTETSSRRLSEATSSRLIERNPEDRRVRLAEAFLALYRRDSQHAADVLLEILARHRDFAPAHAMYGQALALSSRWSDLPAWLESSPAGTEEFADYWLTLGDYASQNGEFAQAANAYWEATRRDPNQLIAWERLHLMIRRLENEESKFSAQATRYLKVVENHASHLLALRENFNDFTGRNGTSQTGATSVARSLTALGRLWEAEAWSALATTLSEEPSAGLPELRQKIVRQLRQESPWFSLTNPAMMIDLSFLPVARISDSPIRAHSPQLVPAVTATERIRLKEVSDQWGLRSVGKGNNPTDARLAALIRSTGVGAGAIDYDLDGRVDLVVMNAGGTVMLQDSMPNELMRNLGQTYVRVTDGTGVGDCGFGQGVAVGDFNEDGYPDLFFANIGQDCLLRNNGDGTFTDSTNLLPIESRDHWSTSAAFTDMNNDSLADLFVTHYCRIVPELSEACVNSEGVAGPCHPLKFPADTDQVLLTATNGQFIDVTENRVGPVPGRGLGIVAGAISGNDYGIFVANDMSRNSFYTRDRSSEKLLVDNALTRGVAVDGRSQTQASMGIAASDFDLDGDLDFYVTGFAREYNVFYEQSAPGMWVDETSRLGLIEPTLMLVGFGTQAIDLDNDGLDEIAVTNGHIGDFPDPEAPPYEQPLQIFRRSNDSKFAMIDDDDWGNYFRSPHVGRALLTADVNRDGRNDLLITHSNEQIALLLNEGTTANDCIAFKLVGTQCSRDGVGAVIRFKSKGAARTLWQLSGDGYFCSNEKILLAGLSQSDEVTDVEVTWQDGSMDRLGTLPANTLHLIIQGEQRAFPLHHYEK